MPGSQPGIKLALATKEQKDAADLAIGRWWFDANIAFNVARSKFLQPMADAIIAIGPVNAFMEHYKSCWSETGCSVMADGWTDERQRILINFLVYCPKGVMFLKSADASAIIEIQVHYLKFLMKLSYLLGLTILSNLLLTMMPLTKQQEKERLKNMRLFIGQLVPPIA
ncbi:DNA binding protein [Cinnamomum micranthum f. kanehirae]|uniref:DNA binding protein n=1 Tax=Cinnamomum micranthum f. kanehirae TaxID=337451 RepID=A0A3S3MQS2_9MAGN|nr:DNA binding protein [Cinnamomum micranthum f. kanehirae]